MGEAALRLARERFAELLARRNVPEREWQQLFAAFPQILSESLPLRLKPSQIVPRGRPGRSEADFLIYPDDADAGRLVYGAIELKRADTSILVSPREQVLRLSADAQTAYAQAKVYAQNLGRELVRGSEPILALGSHGHIFLIIVLARELQMKVTSEILREQLDGLLPPGVQLMPYDTLFQRFRQRVPPQLYVAITPATQLRVVVVHAPSEAALGRVIAEIFHERNVICHVTDHDETSPDDLDKNDIVLLLLAAHHTNDWVPRVIWRSSQLRPSQFYMLGPREASGTPHHDEQSNRITLVLPVSDEDRAVGLHDGRYPNFIIPQTFTRQGLTAVVEHLQSTWPPPNQVTG